MHKSITERAKLVRWEDGWVGLRIIIIIVINNNGGEHHAGWASTIRVLRVHDSRIKGIYKSSLAAE